MECYFKAESIQQKYRYMAHVEVSLPAYQRYVQGKALCPVIISDLFLFYSPHLILSTINAEVITVRYFNSGTSN
jgi:hypothetical protein